jgi:hypothetical protein
MPAKPSKRLFASTIATASSVRSLLLASGFFQGKAEADIMVFWPAPNGYLTVVMPDGQRLLVGHDGDSMLVGDQAIDTLGEAATLFGIDPLPIDPKALPAPTAAELEAAFDEFEAWIRANGPVDSDATRAYEKRVWAPKWRPEKRNEANRMFMFLCDSGRALAYGANSVEMRKPVKPHPMLPGSGGPLPMISKTMWRVEGQEPTVPAGFTFKANNYKDKPRRSVIECLADFEERLR